MNKILTIGNPVLRRNIADRQARPRIPSVFPSDPSRLQLRNSRANQGPGRNRKRNHVVCLADTSRRFPQTGEFDMHRTLTLLAAGGALLGAAACNTTTEQKAAAGAVGGAVVAGPVGAAVGGAAGAVAGQVQKNDRRP
jgi:hypothetical protein